jgi:hypothetical protein
MLDPREIRAGNWVVKITGTDTNTKPFFKYKAVAAVHYPAVIQNCKSALPEVIPTLS